MFESTCSFYKQTPADRPLIGLSRDTFHPVQANCVSLPFVDNSFDYITTDFLLSKMNLFDIVATIKEWGRVIKSGGLVTMTAGVRHPQSHIMDRLYDEITSPLYGIHFLPEEILRLIFYSAGLEARFETAHFDQKPFMYRYPDNLLLFIEAKSIKDKNSKEVRNAQNLLVDAFYIYRSIQSEKGLRPLHLEEIIHGLMSGNFIIRRDDKNSILGFIRMHDLTEEWMEIGSLYIDPSYRNRPEHYGTGLLKEVIQLVRQRNKNIVVFTDHPTVIKILEDVGGSRLRTVPFEIVLPLLKDRLSHEISIKDTKSVYVLTAN